MIPIQEFKAKRNAAIINLFGQLWVESNGERPTIENTIEHIGCKMQVSANTIRGILKSANIIGKGAKI